MYDDLAGAWTGWRRPGRTLSSLTRQCQPLSGVVISYRRGPPPLRVGRDGDSQARRTGRSAVALFRRRDAISIGFERNNVRKSIGERGRAGVLRLHLEADGFLCGMLE
ncbi:Hypothetical protein NTJ_04185 [Nesidiocoris tenuis]|uniref:Uncharacterized protein n=1 Tax=Nesidiocoris tenuis TaxID=355587 RepID=A0ABN7AGH5_9HEMI|nr:Hypothetical protein NTJ_04185 [Nesidiocoris tenuis]